MTSVHIECTQCGSEDYQLLDPKTGEVQCRYCRKRWIVLELVQKTQTEKYLIEQAKQPRVIMDNTTETDKQLMGMISGVLGLGGCVKRIFSLVIGLIILVVLIIVAVTFFKNM